MSSISQLNPFAALVQGLAQTAFQIAGDLPVQITYQPTGNIAYDTSTGLSTNDAKPITLRGLLSRFGVEDADASTTRGANPILKIVATTDAKLLVAALDLGVTPNENDTLVTTRALARGGVEVKKWKMIRDLGVPGDAIHKLQIREV